MTEYEYIMAQCRKYHFTQCNEKVLRECQSIMLNLTRDELVSVYRFADKVGKREERIKTEDTDALIQEFMDKKGGNVALARKELRERYKAGKDKQRIASVFNVSTKSDKQWVISQIRKERYGNSNGYNYQWKKPLWK